MVSDVPHVRPAGGLRRPAGPAGARDVTAGVVPALQPKGADFGRV
jgi:hypothetical protein